MTGLDSRSAGVAGALRMCWRLSRPYFTSAERRRAFALLALASALSLFLIGLAVTLNEWNGAFYNALQDRDGAEFRRQLGRFIWLAMLFVGATVQRSYTIQALQIRWRRWQTCATIERWVSAGAAAEPDKADNPDQRIAEDVRLFAAQTLELGFGLLTTLASLVAFLTLLWRLSRGVVIAGAAVPGAMIWVALAYALIGIAVTDRIGRALVGLNFRVQATEADLRYGLARRRATGEAPPAARLRDLVERTTEAAWRLAGRQKTVGFVISGYGQFTTVFPYLFLAPQYFSGAMALGSLVQSASAFGQVYNGLSWPVGNYAGLTAWRATADRLSGLEDAIAGAEAVAAHRAD